MSGEIQRTTSGQETVVTFNKSRTILDAMLSSNQKIWEVLLSYDPKYGMYKVLVNVFNSYASTDFREDENVHSVEDLAIWLYSQGKFSEKKLSLIKAINDASFFSWLRRTAIRAIIDSRRKHHMDFTDLNDTLLHNDKKTNYEERDLLLNILKSTNLTTFQKYIIQYHDIEGYTPQEIVKMYGERNQHTYTLNYYYSQRSKALASLAKVARTM